MKLEIKKIGNSTGIILPKELLARIGFAQGDSVFVTETADGGIKISPRDPEFERGMEIARKAMRKYKTALRELAK
ncbi:MAG: AbrB/MazE/SpoVT family DNA-binding domain-containing protein [Proteobacteria bacterium]|nr:AbrB/MazE/SpoVT family DNA-binding domain-containing protein [Pseudomonadota bacterium]